MPEHYTGNTVSASRFCTKCQKSTQHRIDSHRIGPCLNCLDRLNQQHQELIEAQFVLCRQHLRQLRCPICERPKESNQCFCRQCYFSLPRDLQLALWINRTDRKSLTEWSEKYTAAKHLLRSQGHDQKTGDLFADLT